MTSSKYSELDLEKEYIPVWEESPEVYYDPVILEIELEKIKKDNAELKYQCSELDEDNKRLKIEIQTKEKEKTELHNLFKQSTIKLPIYQAKILELNKDVTKLSMDNKNLLITNSNLKERREEMEKKYKDATDRYAALVTINHQLEKVKTKCKLVKFQEHKSELKEKTKKVKKKSKDDELEIQNKSLKAQISHHADELRSKEVLAKDLERKNKILASKVEDTLVKLKDSQKLVKVLEDKVKATVKECSESVVKYSSLSHENILLKIKLKETDELIIKNDELKSIERGLRKQINTYKRMYLAGKLEKEKLEEFINQLKKEKTKYIYTGEDITIMKRKNEECEKERRELSEKFGDLDCPFYQTNYGKGDEDLKLRCGSITEKQYKNKIFALEHVIKSLHSKIDLIEKKQLQYREIVVESLYDVKNSKNKEKELEALLEKQKYEIIYDKIEVLAKETKIQKLEIQKNTCDDQCKLLNRQSTVLCRQLRNGFKKIESMKKSSMKANKILKDVEEKKKELQIETQQSEKSKKILQTQLKFKKKCQDLQQLETDKMRSSIEEFQKKIYKLQEDVNSKKQKIEELTKIITQLRTESELSHKMHSKEMNNVKNEIGKLNIQNNTLTFEIKCLSKLEKENNDLKSKLMAEQRALVYLQKKFDKLFTAKQQNISLMRLPKYLEKIVASRRNGDGDLSVFEKKYIKKCELQKLK
ncbi:hypothetical protein QTP88_015870 [Uroleucon formosanum]